MKTIHRTASLLAVVALVLTACTSATPAAKVSVTGETVTVSTGSVENRVVATGRVTAKASYSAGFLRSGTVVRKAVNEGDWVSQGQVLAELDTRDLTYAAEQAHQNYLSAQASYSATIKPTELRDIDSARAALASATASLNSAHAQVSTARAGQVSAEAALAELQKGPTESAVEQALRTWNAARNSLYSAQTTRDKICGPNNQSADCRMNEATVGVQYENERKAYQQYLDAQKGATNDKLAASQSSVQSAKGSLQSAYAQVQSAEANVASARAKLESLQNPVNAESAAGARARMDQAHSQWKQAEDNLANARLLAPASGLVTSVKFQPGDPVGANAALVTIADFEQPQFEADVDEADLGQIKTGQKARIHLQTYPGKNIEATIDSVAAAGTTSNNVVTYKVRMTLDAGDANTPIRLGMSGTSELITGRVDGVTMVPNSVLVIDSNTRAYSVLKQVAGRADPVKVEVKLGYRSGEYVQIVSGVDAGDVLAVPKQASPVNQGPGGPGGPGN